MNLATLRRLFNILQWRGWANQGIYHPQHGPLNLCEALLVACDYDMDVYKESIDFFCELLGVKSAVEITLWERNSRRTESEILATVKKAESLLEEQAHANM